MASPKATLEISTEDSVPTRSRGRTYDAATIAVRDQLVASQKDKKARSFSGVTKENKDEMSRRVRAAGKAIGPDFKVSTIFDEEAGKLFWGPDTVIKALQENQKKAAAK